MSGGYDRWRDPAEPAWAAEPTNEWQPQFPGQRYPGDIGLEYLTPPASRGRAAVVGRAEVQPVSPAPGDPRDGAYPVSPAPDDRREAYPVSPAPDDRRGGYPTGPAQDERRGARPVSPAPGDRRGVYPVVAAPGERRGGDDRRGARDDRDRRGWDDPRATPDGRVRPAWDDRQVEVDGRERRGWADGRGADDPHRRGPDVPADREHQRGPEWTVDRDRTAGWHGDRERQDQRWGRPASGRRMPPDVPQRPISPAPEPGWLPEPGEVPHRPQPQPPADRRPDAPTWSERRWNADEPATAPRRDRLERHDNGFDGPQHRESGPRREAAARAETYRDPGHRPAPDREGPRRPTGDPSGPESGRRPTHQAEPRPGDRPAAVRPGERPEGYRPQGDPARHPDGWRAAEQRARTEPAAYRPDDRYRPSGADRPGPEARPARPVEPVPPGWRDEHAPAARPDGRPRRPADGVGPRYDDRRPDAESGRFRPEESRPDVEPTRPRQDDRRTADEPTRPRQDDRYRAEDRPAFRGQPDGWQGHPADRGVARPGDDWRPGSEPAARTRPDESRSRPAEPAPPRPDEHRRPPVEPVARARPDERPVAPTSGAPVSGAPPYRVGPADRPLDRDRAERPAAPSDSTPPPVSVPPAAGLRLEFLPAPGPAPRPAGPPADRPTGAEGVHPAEGRRVDRPTEAAPRSTPEPARPAPDAPAPRAPEPTQPAAFRPPAGSGADERSGRAVERSGSDPAHRPISGPPARPTDAPVSGGPSPAVSPVSAPTGAGRAERDGGPGRLEPSPRDEAPAQTSTPGRTAKAADAWFGSSRPVTPPAGPDRVPPAQPAFPQPVSGPPTPASTPRAQAPTPPAQVAPPPASAPPAQPTSSQPAAGPPTPASAPPVSPQPVSAPPTPLSTPPVQPTSPEPASGPPAPVSGPPAQPMPPQPVSAPPVSAPPVSAPPTQPVSPQPVSGPPAPPAQVSTPPAGSVPGVADGESVPGGSAGTADRPAEQTDPEQALAALRWRLHPETLREEAPDPAALRAVRDRLTAKLGVALDNKSRARLLSLRAVASRILGDLDDALADGRLALTYAEASGELRRTALARARLAQVLRWRGDHVEADRLFAEANSPELPGRLRAVLHEHAGRSCYDQGRLIEACQHFERALDLRQDEDPELAARTAVALDAVRDRAAANGFGPRPRSREEILRSERSPVPTFDEESERWGYADADGNLVIDHQYAEVQPFREGMAWVRRPEASRWALIDESGAALIEANNGYRAVGSFAEGLAWVSMDGKGNWMAVDPTNIVRIPPGFEDVRPFRSGLAAVRQNGGWGAVDRTGQVVVPTRYHGFATTLADGRHVDGFTEEGLAVVELAGRRGVVDRQGRVLVAPVYPTLVVHPVAFLIGDESGRWGARDRRGQPLIDPVHPSRAKVVAEIDRLLADTTPVL